MKTLLVLILTFVTTSVFAEAGRRCNLNDLKIAQKIAIKKHVAKNGGYRHFPGLKIYAPQADFQSYIADGLTFYPAGYIEFNNLEYDILEGDMIYVTLNSACRFVDYRASEISPE